MQDLNAIELERPEETCPDMELEWDGHSFRDECNLPPELATMPSVARLDTEAMAPFDD